jgi:hypothetical protein
MGYPERKPLFVTPAWAWLVFAGLSGASTGWDIARGRLAVAAGFGFATSICLLNAWAAHVRRRRSVKGQTDGSDYV